MASFSKVVNIDKRLVEFVANNCFSDELNAAAIQACERILVHPPFVYFPRLRIRLLGKVSSTAGFLPFVASLSSSNEKVASMMVDQAESQKDPELTLYIDVALGLVVRYYSLNLTGEYLNNILSFAIPQQEKAAFFAIIQENLLHEATHILHVNEGTFVQESRQAVTRLDGTLKQFAIYKSEEERVSIKLLRAKIPGFSTAPETKFLEELLKNIRLDLKLFLDLVYYEGLAEYVGKYRNYPFTAEVLASQQSRIMPFAEKSANDIKGLLFIATSYHQKVLEKNKVQGVKGLNYNDVVELNRTAEKVLDEVKALAYPIGPFLVYVVRFGDRQLSIRDLMKLNSFQFIRSYETACASLGLRPLVSLTSGLGIFDYKRVLEEWSIAAKQAHMQKI